jgi:hypothetical protein
MAFVVPSGHQSTSMSRQKRQEHSFEILKLPGELRELIFSFTFGEKIEPWPSARCRKRGWKAIAVSRAASTNLLLANHQVCKEVTDVMHMQSLFIVEHLSIFSRLVGSRTLRGGIRRLSICLGHENFFKLFGSNYGDTTNPLPTVRLLRHMNLKQLVLVIAPPPKSGEYPYTVCQSSIVDKIFEEALPWISGHPVVVMGWVKQAQKEAFEKKCAQARQQYLEWYETLADKEDVTPPIVGYQEWMEDDGGVSLLNSDTGITDGAEAGGTHGETDSESEDYEEYPPRCNCKHSCDYDLWSPWSEDITRDDIEQESEV